MRVTNNMMTARILQNLRTTSDRLLASQDQLATGKRLARPSDDPTAVVDALRLRTAIAEGGRYKANVDDAANWLEVQEDALDQTSAVLQRVRELVLYAASDACPDVSRSAIAEEIEELRGQVLQYANATYGDRYVFGGHQTQVPPFDPATYSYRGDSGEITREIGPGVTMTINVPGDQVFGSLLATMNRIAVDMRAGNTAGLSGTRLTELDADLDRLLALRSETGAKVNRLEFSRDQLGDLEVRFTDLLSKVEDADLARTILELKNQENARTMALQAGARIIQPTLMDFLR